MDIDKQRSHVNHFFLHLFFCQVKQLTTAAMSAAAFTQQRKHETVIQFFHRIRKKLQPLAKGSQELLFPITWALPCAHAKKLTNKTQTVEKTKDDPRAQRRQQTDIPRDVAPRQQIIIQLLQSLLGSELLEFDSHSNSGRFFCHQDLRKFSNRLQSKVKCARPAQT